MHRMPGVTGTDLGAADEPQEEESMQSPTTGTYEGWIDHDVFDQNGDKIGSVATIYYDDRTGRPEWLAINTGLFGVNTTFVPISEATEYVHDGNVDLQVPFTKDFIKDAPNVNPTDGHLTEIETERLFSHYGYDMTARRYGRDERFDRDYQIDTQAVEVPESRMQVQETGQAQVQRRPVGEARIRKYQVVERRQVEVPLVHEEVQVETDDQISR